MVVPPEVRALSEGLGVGVSACPTHRGCWLVRDGTPGSEKEITEPWIVPFASRAAASVLAPEWRFAPMTSVSAIAMSGMQAAQARLGVSAHNMANLGTDRFHRQRATSGSLVTGGVVVQIERIGLEGHSLERDVVEQLRAKNAFLANLAVFRASDGMAGALLSIRA